jgi:hypothetical protein
MCATCAAAIVEVPACTTIAAVEALIKDIDIASGLDNASTKGTIDAAITCSTGPDHTHKDTLIQIDPSVPVYGPPDAVKKIRFWNHNDNVYVTPAFSGNGVCDWRAPAQHPWGKSQSGSESGV